MTDKIHITKVENSQVERGVQMRDAAPTTPVDKQIWYDEANGNLSVYVDGAEKVLNLRVLAADPASPTENEAWINHTTSQLKYKYSGVIYTMAIGASVTPDGSTSTGGYIRVLGEAELRTISDINLNYPNSMIEAFNDVKASVTLTTAEVVGSRLRPSGSGSGQYERNTRTSGLVNSVDGILVASIQGLQPVSIASSGGGYDVVFSRDVRGMLGNGRKVIGWQIVTVDGVEKYVHMIDATTGNPLQFTVNGTPTFNTTTKQTTVNLTTGGFDITLSGAAYSGIRFAPFETKVTAGGNGTSGATELTLLEIQNLETRRILGEEVVQNLEKTYAGGVMEITANSSPDKSCWMILAKVRRLGALGDDYVVWYSVDNLKTIQQATSFTSPAAPTAETHSSANDSYGSDVHANQMRKESIIIHNDGRFIFLHRYYNGSWYKAKGYYGKMTSSTFDYRLMPRTHDGDGEISIGARHEYDHVMAMDWDTDFLAASFTYVTATPSYDAYILFYKFNWTAMSCTYYNYCHPGVNYGGNGYPSLMFWKTFEGEKMLFWTQTHSNGNHYAYKYPQANIANIAIGPGTNITAVTYLGVATQLSAFTNSTVAGGTRGERADWQQQVGANSRMLGWCWNADETELLMLKADDQTNIFLVTLNFGRTSSGTYLHFPLSTNVTTVYQYSVLGSMIALEAGVGALFGYEAGWTTSNTFVGRHMIAQRMLCGENNEVYIVSDWCDTANTADSNRSRFIKIPNYTQCRGLHYVNAPATPVMYNLGDPARGATYGTKLAQIVTIPTAGNTFVAANYAYSDSKVHIRTVGIYGYNTYATQKCYNPNHKMKIKICGTSAGAPDLTNVLAESIEVREIDFTPYNDSKWYPFPLTTDLRINTGTQIAIVLELNFDPTTTAERNPTTLATTAVGWTAITTGTGTGMYVMNAAGTWVSAAQSMYYRFFDMYYGMTSDMQGNTYYQGPCQLTSSFTNEDSETSIAWNTDRAARKIAIVYRNSDSYQVASTNHSGEGSHAKTFKGYIQDASQYAYPTFATPSLLGDVATIDPYLMFGVNFGDDSSRFINSRLGTVETMYTSGNTLTTEGYNYRAYGGIPYNAVSHTDLNSLMSRTNLAYGIKADTDFLSGKCLQFGASTYVQYRYGTLGHFPGSKDFCVEFEYKPSTADMDTGNQNMIISAEGFIRAEMQNGKYQFQVWGNPSETWSFRSTESVVAGYQRIRYGRTFAGGAFISVSTNNGATWTALTLAGGANPMSIAGGRVIGLQTTGYDIIRFGDYSQSVGTYGVTGAIGYCKFIIGAAAPTYTGLIDMTTSPIDLKRIYNFGDRAIAMRLLQNTYSTSLFNTAAVGLMYFDDSSIKPTKDQVFRYKQAITQGRTPYLKIDMVRNSSSDPLSIQGYLLNFERK